LGSQTLEAIATRPGSVNSRIAVFFGEDVVWAPTVLSPSSTSTEI
jgi:hypothetical protein